MPHGSVIYELAQELGEVLSARKLCCAVAESCTGGSLAGTITAIPGSSKWFDRGFVTYSNQAKEQMLHIPRRLITLHGAVSEEVARAMAEGVITESDANVSAAITGIAGPGGGSDEKPIGTVWIAWSGDFQPTYSHCYHFEGNRPAIRHQAVQTALEGLIKRCDSKIHSKRQKKSKARYFFALFPEEQTANALIEQAGELINSEDCTPVIKANLHLTLVYLGNVPPDFLQEAIRVAVKVKEKAFDCRINKVSSWPSGQINWLGMKNVPDELHELVNKLKNNLLPAGFVPERKSFIPHITIARKCTQQIQSKEINDILWPVNEFCLVKSMPTDEGSHYEKIASWPLKQSR